MNGRRVFLRGLATLPLIGGSVAIIGQPTATAEPVTPDLLEAYKTWLDMELRCLCWDMAADPVFVQRYRHHPGGNGDQMDRSDAIARMLSYIGDSGGYHGGITTASPYTRAAVVLSAVGCGWQRDPNER